MYKADLWRLCKLYIHGGIYADVDLVPYINIDNLDKNITFYSCLSLDDKSIFQAFMINFSKPKNPLLFIFLLSFLLNNPYTYTNGPTFDMYNCIKYNINTKPEPDTKYDLDNVCIHIHIGSSNTNIKIIHLYYFPEDIEYSIIVNKHEFSDEFEFIIKNNILIVKRIDSSTGWGHNHSIVIKIPCQESIYLFQEKDDHNRFITAYVNYKSQKILDSRDINYTNNNGW